MEDLFIEYILNRNAQNEERSTEMLFGKMVAVTFGFDKENKTFSEAEDSTDTIRNEGKI